MAKISPVSAKYIIHATINIDGVVDRPDVIGAIFGQTEGLLGSDLELRELQRSGRIGRIEVNLDTKSGKTNGTIVIPSSLDKAETSIVAAALEIIQRIGPCNAKIKVHKIEDVRISKRNFVVERAKELLKQMVESILPDSQELADEVAYSVRVMEICDYGKDRLPAGPSVDESDEIIVVEGRADVLIMLKHGFKNVIAINGSSIPETIVELSKKKEMTVFVDGDRGGDLNFRELDSLAEVDFFAKAPDGKEVEELTKKEIHKALRGKIAAEQARMEFQGKAESVNTYKKPVPQRRPAPHPRPQQRYQKPVVAQAKISSEDRKRFKEMLEDLIGTRGAYVLEPGLNILGKVPVTELAATLKSLNTDIYAIIFDGEITKEIVSVADKIKVKYLVAMDTKVKQSETKITLLTASDL
ncbi:DNA primase DnaG [Nanoarchaeota archaeon]